MSGDHDLTELMSTMTVHATWLAKNVKQEADESNITWMMRIGRNLSTTVYYYYHECELMSMCRASCVIESLSHFKNYFRENQI